MTLTLNIPEEVEASKRVRLAVALYDARAVSQEQAAELAGLTPTAFLETLDAAGVSAIPRPPEELTVEERLRLFEEWADGHPKDSPLLTDEEISREALYAGTGGDR